MDQFLSPTDFTKFPYPYRCGCPEYQCKFLVKLQSGDFCKKAGICRQKYKFTDDWDAYVCYPQPLPKQSEYDNIDLS